MGLVLVAYFSRSGATARVAEQLSAKLGAELDRIDCEYSYAGIGGYFKGIAHSLLRREAPIRYQRDPDNFSMVIIGSPVWAGHLSVPMRSYLSRARGRFHKVAAFWVSGSGGAYPSIATEIAGLSGRPCLTTQSFSEREVKASEIDGKLQTLAKAVQQAERSNT